MCFPPSTLTYSILRQGRLSFDRVMGVVLLLATHDETIGYQYSLSDFSALLETFIYRMDTYIYYHKINGESLSIEVKTWTFFIG